MAGYLGNVPVPQATQTRDRFVATAGQTSFPTSGYTAGYLDVFLNGVKLDSTDYTATNGSDVVLTAGATADDIIEVVAFSTFEVLNQTFSGNTAVTGDLAVTGDVTATDVTLSGGVYLGGTGSANYLDDYEEGTWTPVIADEATAGTVATATVYGHYTKIGRVVHLTGTCRNIDTTSVTASNNVFVRGMPFTVESLSGTNIFCGSVYTSTITAGLNSHIIDGTSVIRFRKLSTDSQMTMVFSDIADDSGDLYFTITYHTTA